ncbi:Uncharacterised protein [uncultured archaeon]|nr:Uncharacterised protein [uncultured archaeon]
MKNNSGLLKKLTVAGALTLTPLGNDLYAGPFNNTVTDPVSKLTPVSNETVQVGPFAYLGLVVSIGVVGYYVYRKSRGDDIF